MGSFITTIGIDFKIKTITLDSGKKVKLTIWDTAGQERFRTITSAYYRGAMGILLCYDVTDRETFKCIPKWLESATANASASCMKMLVGTKTDAEPGRVTPEEGEAFAEKHGMQFIETSAKTGDNVDA